MIDEEFREITGMELPERLTHSIEEGLMRKDSLFHILADLHYDSPETFSRLRERVHCWLVEERSGRILSLAGYLSYIFEDYESAADFFLETITLNPGNLDTWMDLAFSLYHGDSRLAYAILFNYDLYIRLYGELGYKSCTLQCIDEISDEIRKRGLELSQNFKAYLPVESSGIHPQPE